MEINLISDTITATQEMLQYMFKAEVGDDVYKQDPTVIELEAKVAAMFGMEVGLFSVGERWRTKQAIKLHTQPGEQLIADKYAHVYHYEGGGAFNGGVSCCLLDGNRGMITAEQVAGAINDPEFYHSPLTSLVCVETLPIKAELEETYKDTIKLLCS
jgi:threonine aldolase